MDLCVCVCRHGPGKLVDLFVPLSVVALDQFLFSALDCYLSV